MKAWLFYLAARRKCRRTARSRPGVKGAHHTGHEEHEGFGIGFLFLEVQKKGAEIVSVPISPHAKNKFSYMNFLTRN
jgi:hypothetical protein